MCVFPTISRTGLLATSDASILFSTIDNLAGASQALLSHLVADESASAAVGARTLKLQSPLRRVADAFVALAPFLKMFSNYCNNYATAAIRLKQLLAATKKVRRTPHQQLRSAALGVPATFAAFVAARRRGGRDLSSLLIAPVQRVCRFPLLFSTLLKKVDAHHPDRARLEHAAAEVRALAEKVNEDRRNAEAQLRVYDLGARTRPAKDLAPRGGSPKAGVPKPSSPRRGSRLLQAFAGSRSNRDLVARAEGSSDSCLLVAPHRELLTSFFCVVAEHKLTNAKSRAQATMKAPRITRKPRILFVFNDCIALMKPLLLKSNGGSQTVAAAAAAAAAAVSGNGGGAAKIRRAATTGPRGPSAAIPPRSASVSAGIGRDSGGANPGSSSAKTPLFEYSLKFCVDLRDIAGKKTPPVGASGAAEGGKSLHGISLFIHESPSSMSRYFCYFPQLSENGPASSSLRDSALGPSDCCGALSRIEEAPRSAPGLHRP